MSSLRQDAKGGLRYSETMQARRKGIMSRVRSMREELLGKRRKAWSDIVDEEDDIDTGSATDTDTDDEGVADANAPRGDDIATLRYRHMPVIKRRNTKHRVLLAHIMVRNFECYRSMFDPISAELARRSAKAKEKNKKIVMDVGVLTKYSQSHSELSSSGPVDSSVSTTVTIPTDAPLSLLARTTLELRKQVHLRNVYARLAALPPSLIVKLVSVPYDVLLAYLQQQTAADVTADGLADMSLSSDDAAATRDPPASLAAFFDLPAVRAPVQADASFPAHLKWLLASVKRTHDAHMHLNGTGYTVDGLIPTPQQAKEPHTARAAASIASATPLSLSLASLAGLEAALVSEAELCTAWQQYFRGRYKLAHAAAEGACKGEATAMAKEWARTQAVARAVDDNMSEAADAEVDPRALQQQYQQHVLGTLRAAGSAEIFASLHATATGAFPRALAQLAEEARVTGSSPEGTAARTLVPLASLFPVASAATAESGDASAASRGVAQALREFLVGVGVGNGQQLSAEDTTPAQRTLAFLPAAPHVYTALVPLLLALGTGRALSQSLLCKCFSLLGNLAVERNVCLALVPLLGPLLQFLAGKTHTGAFEVGLGVGPAHEHALTLLGNVLREPGVVQLMAAQGHATAAATGLLPVADFARYGASYSRAFALYASPHGPDAYTYMAEQQVVTRADGAVGVIGTNGLPDFRNRRGAAYLSGLAHPHAFDLQGAGDVAERGAVLVPSLSSVEECLLSVVARARVDTHVETVHSAVWVLNALLAASQDNAPVRDAASSTTTIGGCSAADSDAESDDEVMDGESAGESALRRLGEVLRAVSRVILDFHALHGGADAADTAKLPSHPLTTATNGTNTAPAPLFPASSSTAQHSTAVLAPATPPRTSSLAIAARAGGARSGYMLPRAVSMAAKPHTRLALRIGNSVDEHKTLASPPLASPTRTADTNGGSLSAFLPAAFGPSSATRVAIRRQRVRASHALYTQCVTLIDTLLRRHPALAAATVAELDQLLAHVPSPAPTTSVFTTAGAVGGVFPANPFAAAAASAKPFVATTTAAAASPHDALAQAAEKHVLAALLTGMHTRAVADEPQPRALTFAEEEEGVVAADGADAMGDSVEAAAEGVGLEALRAVTAWASTLATMAAVAAHEGHWRVAPLLARVCSSEGAPDQALISVAAGRSASAPPPLPTEPVQTTAEAARVALTVLARVRGADMPEEPTLVLCRQLCDALRRLAHAGGEAGATAGDAATVIERAVHGG